MCVHLRHCNVPVLWPSISWKRTYSKQAFFPPAYVDTHTVAHSSSTHILYTGTHGDTLAPLANTHEQTQQQVLFDFSPVSLHSHPSPLVKGLQRICPYFVLQHSRRRQKCSRAHTAAGAAAKAYRFVAHQSSNENLFTFFSLQSFYFFHSLSLSLSLLCLSFLWFTWLTLYWVSAHLLSSHLSRQWNQRN